MNFACVEMLLMGRPAEVLLNLALVVRVERSMLDPGVAGQAFMNLPGGGLGCYQLTPRGLAALCDALGVGYPPSWEVGWPTEYKGAAVEASS